MLVATLSRNKIKGLLDEQGRSIYWLANQVDMSYQAIHRLVTSPTIPDGTSYSTLKRISDALGVGIDDLVSEEEQ
jgi:DNA-binding Xre family transcriptional regulator